MIFAGILCVASIGCEPSETIEPEPVCCPCQCAIAEDCSAPIAGPCGAWRCDEGLCAPTTKDLGDPCVTADGEPGECRSGDPQPYGYCWPIP